jgi:hypothetical protein
MTASRSDILITSDLAALADASRLDRRAIDDSLRLTGAYRDDRPGAEARRDELLGHRRRELALMPLSLAHVFAHRIARAAAGGVAVLCAAVMAVVLADPLLTRLAAVLVPGLNVPLCLALAGLAVLTAYVVASWIAERVFERRMQRAITTAGDAYADLDHLAEGPVDVGRGLVRAADRWAVMLSLAGVATAVPLLSFVVFAIGTTHSYAYAWSHVEPLMSLPITVGIGAMVAAMAAGIAGAVMLGLACDHEHRRGELPRWAGLLAHWSVVPIGILAGLLALYGGLRSVHAFQIRGIAPSDLLLTMLATSGVASVFLQAAWAVLWWRRREHARLGL